MKEQYQYLTYPPFASPRTIKARSKRLTQRLLHVFLIVLVLVLVLVIDFPALRANATRLVPSFAFLPPSQHAFNQQEAFVSRNI
jgi:hypothetical protein